MATPTGEGCTRRVRRKKEIRPDSVSPRRVAPRRVGPRPGRARHAGALAAGLASFLLAISTVVGSAPLLDTSAAAAPAPHVTVPSCPLGYACSSLPCSTSPCPTVQAGPTSNLGTNQAVYFDLYNFNPSDTPAIWLCQNSRPLAQGPPLCASSPRSEQLPIFADGTSSASYAVDENDPSSGVPFSGVVPGDGSISGKFYCDGGPNPCSLDLFVPGYDGHSVPTARNTVVVPISFLPPPKGCPDGTVVQTESDFGIDGLLKQIGGASCSGSHPAVAVNTAEDSLGAVNALTDGGAQIAFTDDPLAADEQAALAASPGHTYVLIPVAASATVVAFQATESPWSDSSADYAQSSFELTPTMVAGLVTDQYSAPGTADSLGKKTSCANPDPPPAKKLKPCPGIEALNDVSQFLPPLTYGTYVRSDNAGVTDQMFSWLCAATNHPITVGGRTYTEPLTAAQVLAEAPWTSAPSGCPDTDMFPPLATQTGDWSALANPSKQATSIATQFQNVGRSAAFAVMNWYSASYYGLDTAALQNAAGDFVTPTQKSVDAALADASVNPYDGALTFDYTNANDANAYPMPSVTYALVRTDGQSAAQSAAIRTVLEAALSETVGPHTDELPPGLIALPSDLGTQAQALVDKYFPAQPGSTGPNGGGGGGEGDTGSGTPGGDGNGYLTSDSTSPFGDGVGLGTQLAAQDVRSTGSDGLPKHASGTGHRATSSAVVALVAPAARWLLAVILAVGAAALIGGPGLLAALGMRRRGAGGEEDPVLVAGGTDDGAAPDGGGGSDDDGGGSGDDRGGGAGGGGTRATADVGEGS